MSTRYRQIIQKEKSNLAGFETHLRLHRDCDGRADQIQQSLSDAQEVVAAAGGSPNMVIANYDKLKQIKLGEISEMLDQFDQSAQQLVPDSYTRESSEMGVRYVS